MTDVEPELTTVSESTAVVHRGAEVRRYDGLEPGTVHHLDGVEAPTLPHPGGALLSRFGTVNDVHFGEVECGVIEGLDMGPILSSGPDEAPYPEVMNAGAIAELTAADLAAVIVKGDLTANGTDEEYAAFCAAYEPAFGERLLHVRGNHDGYHGGTYAAWPTQRLDLPGVTIALLDTTTPLKTPGRITDDQLEWLDDVAATADQPVLVFGHHHCWDPSSATRADDYFGIHPDASERLVELIGRRPLVQGYFAGHTHRNRVRRFAGSGPVPYVEVACVKDYPGAWAEYRVFEGGILQVHHRISTPEALAWTEKTRAMFGGIYPEYAFGRLDERCFALPAR